MNTIIELTFQMKELRRRLGSPTGAELYEAYDITDELVQKLETDTWLQLSRKDLFTLFALEKRVSTTNDPFELLVKRPHPLWSTFAHDSVALVFPARTERGIELPADSKVLAQLLETTGLSRLDAHVFAKGDPDVAALMRTHNAIFMGSPKRNDETEVAICTILGRGTAFDSGDENRARLPFQFFWETWEKDRKEHTSAFGNQATDARPHGLSIAVNEGTMRHLPLTPRYADATQGWDIGVLLMKRFCVPSSNRKVVTSIVVAGHSSFATAMVAKDIASGAVYIGEDAASQENGYVLRFLLCGWKRKGPKHKPDFEPIASARRWFTARDWEEIRDRLDRPAK